MTYEEFRAKYTLPSLCLDLRMAYNGSADPFSEEEKCAALAYLKRRLAEWKPTVWPPSAKFDEAVRQLVIATIEEVEAR